MESEHLSYPAGYLSVNRYTLVAFLTAFLVLPMATMWDFFFGYVADRSINAFLEMLATLPVLVLVQLTFGWFLWVPVILISLVVGMPVWILAIKYFAKKQLSPRLSVLLASLLVVLITSVSVDTIMIVTRDGANQPIDYSFLTNIGPFAAVIACISTQLVYGFKR